MYIKIRPQNITSAEAALVIKALRLGEVIVYPTDTIYGLGCLATDVKAINRINAIKKRDKDKPLLILVSSIYMAKKYCLITKPQTLILKELWALKRPTSVILRSRNILPAELNPKQEGLAVRLPKSNFLRKIIKMVGAPIVSTSFNISGEPVCNKVSSQVAQKLIKKGPSLIIDAGILNNKPSKIIDLTGSKLKIIRQ